MDKTLNEVVTQFNMIEAQAKVLSSNLDRHHYLNKYFYVLNPRPK